MLNGRYFKGIDTLEELKKQYRTLAMQNHPDRGGDLETMKAINAEYDNFFKKVKDTHKTKDGETYRKETAEAPEEFRDIIEKLIRMSSIQIEIIGSFIWFSGDTRPHKDGLKALGFRWSSSKKMWYKSPEGYRRRGKKNYSMEQIRDMYGVQAEYTGKSQMQIGA